MFCIYKTDPNWIKTLRTLNPDVQVNFWRKGKNALNIPLGSWFYFNERRTRNIVGRGVLVGYEVLRIKDAWMKFGVGNGVSNYEELEQRALSILDIEGENPEVGCILLSELQFLNEGDEYVVSHADYAPQIVGPKYFEDNELPELTAKFSADLAPRTLLINEPSPSKYYEGNEVFSYRVGYERNAEARMVCLSHHGYSCNACGLNLEVKYGSIAREFIHVHHMNQISDSGGQREVNPILDLVPLCPNCHAVVHRRSPPFSIEELRGFIAKANNPAR